MAEGMWQTLIIDSGSLSCIIRDMGQGVETKYVENVSILTIYRISRK